MKSTKGNTMETTTKIGAGIFHFGSVTDGKAIYKIGKGTNDYSRKVKYDEDTPYVIHRGFKYSVNEALKTMEYLPLGITPLKIFSKEELGRMALGLSNTIEGTNYLLTDGEKICRCCNEAKDAADYHKNKTLKDGLDSTCKSCKAKRNKANKKVLTH